MLTAVSWDGEQPLSVMERLRQRSRDLNDADSVSTVVALVFAQPDSEVAEQLIKRRAYFDYVTGENWDVFFPGYFAYGSMGDPDEQQLEGSDWGFSPRAFWSFKKELTGLTGWEAQGESELVLINAILSSGEPVVDSASIQWGPLTDLRSGTMTLTLDQVVERVSNDLKSRREAADYGIPEVLSEPNSAAFGTITSERDSATGRLATTLAAGATGNVLGAILRGFLGLP